MRAPSRAPWPLHLSRPAPAAEPLPSPRQPRASLRLRAPRFAGRAWTGAARWWRCRCRARLRANTASASFPARRSPRTGKRGCRGGGQRGGGHLGPRGRAGRESWEAGRAGCIIDRTNVAYEVNRIYVHLRVEKDSFGFGGSCPKGRELANPIPAWAKSHTNSPGMGGLAAPWHLDGRPES